MHQLVAQAICGLNSQDPSRFEIITYVVDTRKTTRSPRVDVIAICFAYQNMMPFSTLYSSKKGIYALLLVKTDLWSLIFSTVLNCDFCDRMLGRIVGCGMLMPQNQLFAGFNALGPPMRCFRMEQPHKSTMRPHKSTMRPHRPCYLIWVAVKTWPIINLLGFFRSYPVWSPLPQSLEESPKLSLSPDGNDSIGQLHWARPCLHPSSSLALLNHRDLPCEPLSLTHSLAIVDPLWPSANFSSHWRPSLIHLWQSPSHLWPPTSFSGHERPSQAISGQLRPSTSFYASYDLWSLSLSVEVIYCFIL